MNFKAFKLVLYFCVYYCIISCNGKYQLVIYNEGKRYSDSLEVREYLISDRAQRIEYKKDGISQAVIKITAPKCIVQAEQEEPWGFYQFPSIGRTNDGKLIVSWQMQEDSHKSYGRMPNRKVTPMMSKDKGNTWIPQDKSYKLYSQGYNINLSNGDYLEVYTPPAKDIRAYKTFPKEVSSKGNTFFYRLASLPKELQGIYMSYRSYSGESKTIHSTLSDPGALRYAIDGLMPIVWWGNIKELADKSLIAGIYPALYQDSLGKVMPGGVSFYKSDDVGSSWHVIGKIPFIFDGIANIRGNLSFDEPAFEILNDSTFLCVMRSGAVSPMYKTFSSDRGKTWSRPVPFTPNGVKPRLLKLKNGVLVLASGRPGIQIRFSYDGTGRVWSDPLDMIPFMKSDGSYNRKVSCGYASIIEADNNSFYIVYSDFTNKDFWGRTRKTIFCRKVTVDLEGHDR